MNKNHEKQRSKNQLDSVLNKTKQKSEAQHYQLQNELISRTSKQKPKQKLEIAGAKHNTQNSAND